MDQKEDIVIGIVGGMGPEAGLTLCNRILYHTRAGIDQEHLSTVLMSFPRTIADRTLFLEGRTKRNPAFPIAEVLKKLENAGARVAGIACNTAHAHPIYDVILEELDKANSQIHLLNMPLETCRCIREDHSAARRVGVITTNGAYRAAIYKDQLEEWGYEVVVPPPDFQNDVIHKMIYDPGFGIKSNPLSVSRKVMGLMGKTLDFFEEKRADAVILGCTELSAVSLRKRESDLLIVDSTDSLARALVRQATRAENKAPFTDHKKKGFALKNQ